MAYFVPAHWNALRHGATLAERIIHKETSWSVDGVYDLKTSAGLEEAERGIFAQIFRIEEELVPRYRVYLQDNEILRFIKNHEDIDLLSFITFIMTHELLHIHRFSTGMADFFGSPHDEEIVVDALTRVFLAKNPVIGLKKVLTLLDKLEAVPLYNNHIMHDGGRCFYAYL